MSSPQPNENKQQSYVGMKVDWEMKALAIAAVFAAVKAAQKFLGTFIPVTICRAIFTFGHIYFIYIYFNTSGKVTKSTSRSTEEKVKIKAALSSILKSLIVKAVVILAVHWKTQLMPPLVVSVILGFFSFIENDYYYQVMYTVTPKLFEILYG
jgi:hypothetical protein